MVSGPNLNETSIVSGGYGGTAEGIIPTSSVKGVSLTHFILFSPVAVPLIFLSVLIVSSILPYDHAEFDVVVDQLLINEDLYCLQRCARNLVIGSIQ